MASVQILNVDHVAPYPTPNNPMTKIPLSFFDAYWISLPPIQRLFIYPDIRDIPLSSLKDSLSKTLHMFPSFAGKLTYLPADNDIIIGCAGKDSVTFVEAECDGDIKRLVDDQIHDTETFVGLVPELDNSGALPMPILAVQVTKFVNGGMSMGVSIHHVVADGNGVWQFMGAWAKICRGEEVVTTPVHDRSVIQHDRSDEIRKQFIKQLAPDIPQMMAHTLTMEQRLRIQRRTFILSSSAILSLKQQITNQSSGAHRISSFSAISAYTWVCFSNAIIKLKDKNPAHVIHLPFLADCRQRLSPPLPDTYVGNCVKGCFAQATLSKLVDSNGLSNAQAEIARAIQEETHDPLCRCEKWVDAFIEIPDESRFVVSGSPRFRVYELDFGWGKPDRVELVSMNKDGEIVLVEGKELGSVQVSVGLNLIHMELFAKFFEDGLVGNYV